MSYYDDISDGSSDNHGSMESDEEKSDVEDQDWLIGRRRGRTQSSSVVEKKFSTLATGLWHRCVLHLDVDCFYCQCEEIDRGLRKEKTMRPLAIGQKHIIVTSNYEARRCGVSKLQSRDAAYKACPHLWIVEGSDLLHYRRHSRAIYEAFRSALEDIAMELGGSFQIPARKGCMDEMMADLTPAVEKILDGGHYNSSRVPDPEEQTRFVFGEDGASSLAVLVEDQTGQKSVVSFKLPDGGGGAVDAQEATLAPSRRNVHNMCGATERDQTDCQQRLQIAADLTERICRHIQRTTDFHTTGGISVSPLLAKLASGLHKPNSVNVLFPWRSSQLLYSMPLRKMHRIGRATAKAVENQIAQEEITWGYPNGHSPDATSKEHRITTVLDLLELPRSSLRDSIRDTSPSQSDTWSEDHSELLIQQCRGIDTTEVIDDNAGLPKTVSVENSFRRGTLKTADAVRSVMEDLYLRLPLLLRDRASWAKDPKKSYPSTIRLTVRLLDTQVTMGKRRSSKVISRQSAFDGLRHLVNETDLAVQSDTIKRHILPMLGVLLPPRLDVTRINIAMTGFQDVTIAKAQELNGSVQVALDRSRAMSQNSVSTMRSSSTLSSTPTILSQSSNKWSKTPLRIHSMSQPSNKRMKTTRIDHFFVKKS